MSGGANAHYFGIAAFSETDFTDDLQRVDVPVLVLHGEDDQIVPFAISGAKSIKLLRHGPPPKRLPSTPTCWRLSRPSLPTAS
jgi:non-heme chloroperoxidase